MMNKYPCPALAARVTSKVSVRMLASMRANLGVAKMAFRALVAICAIGETASASANLELPRVRHEGYLEL